MICFSLCIFSTTCYHVPVFMTVKLKKKKDFQRFVIAQNYLSVCSTGSSSSRWWCRRILNPPPPTDTLSLQRPMKQFPLKKTWSLAEWWLGIRQTRKAHRSREEAETQSCYKTPLLARRPTTKKALKIQRSKRFKPHTGHPNFDDTHLRDEPPKQVTSRTNKACIPKPTDYRDLRNCS